MNIRITANNKYYVATHILYMMNTDKHTVRCTLRRVRVYLGTALSAILLYCSCYHDDNVNTVMSHRCNVYHVHCLALGCVCGLQQATS